VVYLSAGKDLFTELVSIWFINSSYCVFTMVTVVSVTQKSTNSLFLMTAVAHTYIVLTKSNLKLLYNPVYSSVSGTFLKSMFILS